MVQNHLCTISVDNSRHKIWFFGMKIKKRMTEKDMKIINKYICMLCINVKVKKNIFGLYDPGTLVKEWFQMASEISSGNIVKRKVWILFCWFWFEIIKDNFLFL